MRWLRQGREGSRALATGFACLLALAAPSAASVPSQTVSLRSMVADGSVRALATAGGVTYLGGAFTHVGEDGRAGLAAVDATGALLPFNASLTNADSSGNQLPVAVTGVAALTADLAGQRTTLLAIVGAFKSVGTQATIGLALVYGGGAHKAD